MTPARYYFPTPANDGILASIRKPSLAAIVQDRASEMITHCDDAERVEAIGEELWTLATELLQDGRRG